MAVVGHEIIVLSCTADAYCAIKVDTRDGFSAEEYVEPILTGSSGATPGISKDGQLRSFHMGIVNSGPTIPPENQLIIKWNEQNNLFSPRGALVGVAQGGTNNCFTTIVGG